MTMLKRGQLRADKVRYEDGVGCCIWRLLSDGPGNEDVGLCWDFQEAELDDVIALLQELKGVEPDELQP